jgi:asparagine synthase (glutamine-hydrolysing)
MVDAAHGAATSRDIVAAPGMALGVHGTQGSTALEAQPPLHVAANAAITNAAAIRAELSACGAAFHTATDAELILRAYVQWSTESFARFRGPFTCAIWDAARRRLVLARDHIGIRPLHFAMLPNQGVLFASDIRSLLADPGVPREWCPYAVDAYLTFGFVPAPKTAFRRVTSLEPGHLLIVEGRRLHTERYWDIPAAQSVRLNDALEGVRQDIRQVMDDQAPGAAGLLYSGSLGSTALLACGGRPFSSVVTVDTGLDGAELTRSERAASHLGCARELVDAETIGPGLVRGLAADFDQPVADPRAVTQLAVCRAAKRRTPAAFAATGATTLWSRRPRRSPRPLQDERDRRSLYTRAFAWQVRDSEPHLRQAALLDGAETRNSLARARYVDAHTRLPDSELVIAERAAAATGVVLGYPLLDPIVIARAAAITSTLKRRLTDASGLRLLLASRIPRNLLPSSTDHRPPHLWLNAALRSLVPGTLLSERSDNRDIVSRPTLRRLWEEHASGRRDRGGLFWSLLMLELWFRHWVDNDASDEPAEYAVRRAA